MGKAAFIAATRHSRQHVVMASSDRITFDEPVRVGDLIECVASIARVGRASMTVVVDLIHENALSGLRRSAVRGTFEMVVVDANGRPTPDLRISRLPRSSKRKPFVKQHKVRTYKSAERLDRADQLAWKIAAVAADPVRVEDDVAEMIGNRIIDNAAVAAASIARHPVVTARAQARGASASAGRDDLRAAAQPALISRNGRHGRTASRSANSISTTRFWPRIIRTPATTFRRCWRWRSIADRPVGTAARAGGGL